jgi:transposase
MTGFEAEHVLADKAHDTHEIVTYAVQQCMAVVIPSKKNRLEQRNYDTHLYQYRHLVENAFMFLKQWRSIAFRFAKHTAALQIRIIVMWLKIS